MSKVIVSSTPHPRRRIHFKDLFDDDPISPIVQPDLHKTSTEISTLKVRPAKVAKKKNSVLPTNKKNEEKESTSSAILKELGALGSTQRCQLSRSFNRFNMHPQLVIIDSDDEEGSVASSHSQKPPVKKEKKVSKQRAKTNNSANTNVKHCLDSIPELRDQGREVKSAASNTCEKTSPVKAVKQKRPLTSIENTQKNVKRTKKAPVLKRESTILIDSASEEYKSPHDLLSSNLTDNRKKKYMSLLVVGDQSEEEIITFTPRRVKGKSKVNRDVTAEEECAQDRVENGGEMSKKIRKEKPTNVNKKDIEIAADDLNSESPKKENPFSKECLSQFKDIVFKPNQNTGGIISNSLKTEKLSFGYIEITGVFEGKRSNTTYTVLEGRVVATLMGVSRELLSGDILHIKSESGYKFENAGSAQARLLYVKEN